MIIKRNGDSDIQILNEELIENLFKEYYQLLTVYANKFLGDMDESRDIVQNVFAGLIEKQVGTKIHSSAKAHLYTSVKNSCLNTIKKKSVHSKHHENIKYLSPEYSIENDEVFESSELEYSIYKHINDLPSQCKKIFKMNRFQSYTNGEIAVSLGISKRTVETQMSKALKILRTKISPLLMIFVLVLLVWFSTKDSFII